MNCTVPQQRNLRPDDGLNKKGRNMQQNKMTFSNLVVFDLLVLIYNWYIRDISQTSS